MVTYYVVQAFQAGKRGALIADQPRQARNEDHCRLVAERLAQSRAGVVAFSRRGEPEKGDWDDAVIVAQYGRVPDEVLEMAS